MIFCVVQDPEQIRAYEQRIINLTIELVQTKKQNEILLNAINEIYESSAGTDFYIAVEALEKIKELK
jgi:predicted DNA-binding protein